MAEWDYTFDIAPGVFVPEAQLGTVFAIIKGLTLPLAWEDENGQTHATTGRVTDMKTGPDGKVTMTLDTAERPGVMHNLRFYSDSGSSIMPGP